MTILQALKLSIKFSSISYLKSTDNEEVGNISQTSSVSVSKNEEFIYQFLDSDMINSLITQVKIIFQKSIQQRGLLRAEQQLSMDEIDEDDILDLQKLQMNQMELHFNLTDLVSIFWKTHADIFFELYCSSIHEIVLSLMDGESDIHDQRVGAFFICDVLEFSKG